MYINTCIIFFQPSDEPSFADCFVEDDRSTTHSPATPATAYLSDDEEEDERMELCVDGYINEPAHIRPFMFHPQYHCGLTNTMSINHNCPPQLPKCGVRINQQSLWSSVAVLCPTSMADAHNLTADSDRFGLGLISDFLAL